MEFKFNVNKLFPRKINKITHTLIPEDFRGDRREFNECQRHLTRILDEMGEASAKAQGLSKPITSATKLRNSDQTVYLLVDNASNNGLGSVIGLLKVGSKNLFMFDENGIHYQLKPLCVLDFYIHESRQRMGLGNLLYHHMLTEENLRPIKLAIDRPSEKFLSFLQKYYGLSGIIPQNNKFVVFEGFFDDEEQEVKNNRYSQSAKSIESRSSCFSGNSQNGRSVNGVSQSASALPRSAYGRYAAARPPCSMATIIHNTAVLGQPVERTGEVSTPGSKLERPRSLSIYSEEEQKYRSNELSTVPTPAIPDDQPIPSVPQTPAVPETAAVSEEPPVPEVPSISEPEEEPVPEIPEPEIVEKSRENSSVKSSPSCGQEVAGTTQAGHLDLKFYHSPLW